MKKLFNSNWKIKFRKIIFIIKEISSISNVFYEDNFTLEKLQKLSRCFRYYDNIDEVIYMIYLKKKIIQLKLKMIIYF